MIRSTILYILAFIVSFSAQSQDPIFSQPTLSSSYLSPALNGMFQGDYRLHVTYRDQWYTLIGAFSYKTSMASFDYKINPNNQNVFTIGGSVLNDVAGAGSFRQTRGHLTGSYAMQLKGGDYGKFKQFISIGTQIGLGQNGIENEAFWFGRQFDIVNEEINTDLSSGEPIPQDQNYGIGPYLDINLGVAWYAIKTRRQSFMAGASLAHINRPLISNYGLPTDNYRSRLSIHGSGKIMFSSDLGITPLLVINFQGPQQIFQLGSSFIYDLVYLGESGFRVGGFARLANSVEGFGLDGITISAMYERQNAQIGFAYDFTLSNLRSASNSLGGFEISVNYISPGKANFSQPKVPGY